jgi:hypothetical protein
MAATAMEMESLQRCEGAFLVYTHQPAVAGRIAREGALLTAPKPTVAGPSQLSSYLVLRVGSQLRIPFTSD